MSAAPPWNSRDPGASLEALWEFLHAHARDVLAKDGSHVEMLFVVGGDGTLQPQPLVPPMTREQITQTLREQLPGSSVYGLIHIAEAWAYIPTDRGDHTFKQLKLGEMGVSDLKTEHKSEGLTVSMLSRDGDTRAYLDEIIRAPDNTITFGRIVRVTRPRFPLGNVFTPRATP